MLIYLLTVYWNTFEDDEEGFDYKYKLLVDTVFNSYEEAKKFAVEYAKNNNWDIEFVGEDHIYQTKNKNDVADITIVDCEDIDDLKQQINLWG